MDDERMMNQQNTDYSDETREIVSEIIDEMGTIAENTKITGNITTRGHLAVAGTVIGDISAKGNMIITGNVQGKISCSNLMLESCVLNTEINASECVVIKENVKVSGKIFCKDITVMGNVVGDISCSGNIGLSHNAVIHGNISASALGVETGAKIEGNVSIK